MKVLLENGTPGEEERAGEAVSESGYSDNREAVEVPSTMALSYGGGVSQYWIAIGEYTISSAIHYTDPDRLILLHSVYTQKSAQTRDLNFGIDGYRFALEQTAFNEDILGRLPNFGNCSRYWFSTGDIMVAFRGSFMSSKRIESLFNYIRDFMQESSDLRFGVDALDFSYLPRYEFIASSSQLSIDDMRSMSPELPPLNACICECAGNHVDLNWSNFATDGLSDSASGERESVDGEEGSVPQNGDQLVKSSASLDRDSDTESVHQLIDGLQSTSLDRPDKSGPTDNSPLSHSKMSKVWKPSEQPGSPHDPAPVEEEAVSTSTDPLENMRNLYEVIFSIDQVGSGQGFSNFSLEQLEGFAFFLNHFVEVCTRHVEKITALIMQHHLSDNSAQ